MKVRPALWHPRNWAGPDNLKKKSTVSGKSEPSHPHRPGSPNQDRGLKVRPSGNKTAFSSEQFSKKKGIISFAHQR
jgi:hypothetical protein